MPITPAQFIPYRNNYDDYEETQQLLTSFQTLRTNRHPFYLNEQEFERILRWKLRGQYGRGTEVRRHNTDHIIRTISETVFRIQHENDDYETKMRISMLSTIPGVSIPVASAVLTLVEPTRYTVIDFRVWRQMFDEDKRIFSYSDYARYRSRVMLFAGELQWTPQEVDAAIWEYDRRHG